MNLNDWIFSVVWACGALYWLVAVTFFRGGDYQYWDAGDKVLKAVLASLILDLILAGSELFHKIRLIYFNETRVEDQQNGQV